MAASEYNGEPTENHSFSVRPPSVPPLEQPIKPGWVGFCVNSRACNALVSQKTLDQADVTFGPIGQIKTGAVPEHMRMNFQFAKPRRFSRFPNQEPHCSPVERPASLRNKQAISFRVHLRTGGKPVSQCLGFAGEQRVRYRLAVFEALDVQNLIFQLHIVRFELASLANAQAMLEHEQ
jgi:hypothetical protein